MDDAAADLEHMLVHNLKSPVTGLLATLEMLAEGDFGSLSPAQQRAVQDLQGHGAQLLGLIDELLEIGSLESAGVAVHVREVDVREFLADIHEEWSLRLGDRLAVSADDGVDRVASDPVVLRRVLGNLLLNAVMHGGADVRIHCSARTDGDRLLLTVSDNGPGIPAAHAERVFEKFVRLDRPGRPATRGSGLGLAYCRAATQAMGGSIDLQRGGAPGATFVIALPVSQGEAPS